MNCPGCGYGPIGPFTDNCPICAEPVRYDRDDDGRSVPRPQPAAPVSTLLVVGWAVIILIVGYLFWQDWTWVLLSLAMCGAAWWAVASGETVLLRLVGGSLLALFIVGIWLASQPDILPGLDRRDRSPQRIVAEMVEILKGTSQETLRTRARMKTISGVLYAFQIVAVIPLALLVPPLLDARRRRKLGGPIYLTKPQALAGVAVWVLVLPLLGWMAWPTMQTWADAPNNQVHWPQGQWPAPPDDPDEP